MKKYQPRIYDTVLQERLKTSGGILIEGAKWCGKTTTAHHASRSAIFFQDPATRSQNLALVNLAPQELLQRETPLLLDEWQTAPAIWDAVRHEIDIRNTMGQFILTGSAAPKNMEKIMHSGIGRISRMRMRPMALAESGESNGKVSLQALLAGEELPVVKAPDSSLSTLAFSLTRGGWPSSIHLSDSLALTPARDYLDGLVESDIEQAGFSRYKPQLLRSILQSYARLSASQAPLSTIQADTANTSPTTDTTLRRYIDALHNLFIIEESPAWNPNLRSKTAIRATPTRHFTDPSIAAAALTATPDTLMNDLNTFGLLFESLVVRDLRTYISPLRGDIAHFRDKKGLECDAVIRSSQQGGIYGLAEIKLGGTNLIEEGAHNLLKLANSIDTTRLPAPSFLMVITGTGDYSYTRPDGVMVVPIRTLGA